VLFQLRPAGPVGVAELLFCCQVWSCPCSQGVIAVIVVGFCGDNQQHINAAGPGCRQKAGSSTQHCLKDFIERTAKQNKPINRLQWVSCPSIA
jgi:hypothetical protein